MIVKRTNEKRGDKKISDKENTAVRWALKFK